MTITLTLNEAAELCDWEEFCRVTGFSEWARAEGGGNVEATLTLEQARQLGIVRPSSAGESHG